MDLYGIVLFLHSWGRWLVVISGIVVVALAIAGLVGRRPWGTTEARTNLVYVIAVDVTVTLGLILYFFLSPIAQAALGDFGAAMRSSELRFWGLEHMAGMIVALVLAHAASVIVRRGATDMARYRRQLIWFGLSLLVVLLSIPWPFSAVARDLFRFTL